LRRTLVHQGEGQQGKEVTGEEIAYIVHSSLLSVHLRSERISVRRNGSLIILLQPGSQ